MTDVIVLALLLLFFSITRAVAWNFDEVWQKDHTQAKRKWRVVSQPVFTYCFAYGVLLALSVAANHFNFAVDRPDFISVETLAAAVLIAYVPKITRGE